MLAQMCVHTCEDVTSTHASRTPSVASCIPLAPSPCLRGLLESERPHAPVAPEYRAMYVVAREFCGHRAQALIPVRALCSSLVVRAARDAAAGWDCRAALGAAQLWAGMHMSHCTLNIYTHLHIHIYNIFIPNVEFSHNSAFS